MSETPHGVHFFQTNAINIYESPADHLYYFKTYIGNHPIEVERGDCVYYFSDDLTTANVVKGPCHISSEHLATVVRGYMPPKATIALEGITTLPYVNGCSTKQLFSPIRLGDPTLQYLRMPAGSKEQTHHIHATARVVLILSGKGRCIVGMNEGVTTTELGPGTVCILEPMCPHHFETYPGENLIAIPLHIFSSIGPQEKNHPMFNGTVPIA